MHHGLTYLRATQCVCVLAWTLAQHIWDSAARNQLCFPACFWGSKPQVFSFLLVKLTTDAASYSSLLCTIAAQTFRAQVVVGGLPQVF